MIRQQRHRWLVGSMKFMGAKDLVGVMGVAGVMALVVLLCGCSNDKEELEEERQTLEVVPCSQSFLRVEPINDTRAWLPPTGFQLYSSMNSLFSNQRNLVDNTISIFFTKNPGEWKQGRFFLGSGDRWRAAVDEELTENYYLYGFIPDIVTSNIQRLSPLEAKFEDGAKLTLQHMPTVTPSDVCVVVGACNGGDYFNENVDYSVGNLQVGNFLFEAKAKNYIYLLFDHIYSSICFSFKVDGEYNALRTIKLKELRLKPYNGSGQYTQRANVEITLEKTDDGSSPITDIVYTPVGSVTNTDPNDLYGQLLFQWDDPGLELQSIAASEFFGSFVPDGLNEFVLRSKYDVYDKQGNLIREDCIAENKINLNDIYGSDVNTSERGVMYQVSLRITPTYLFLLSDPDLDNPTIKVSD